MEPLVTHLTQYAKSRRDAMIVEMYMHEYKRKSRRDDISNPVNHIILSGFCNTYQICISIIMAFLRNFRMRNMSSVSQTVRFVIQEENQVFPNVF